MRATACPTRSAMRSKRETLMQLVGERISDRRVLKLLWAWLRAGVLERQTLLHPETARRRAG
jgi:hypothetical protein